MPSTTCTRQALACPLRFSMKMPKASVSPYPTRARQCVRQSAQLTEPIPSMSVRSEATTLFSTSF